MSSRVGKSAGRGKRGRKPDPSANLDGGGEAENVLLPKPITDRLFRGIAGSAPTIIWMDDTEGNCIFVNRTWCDFTGRPESGGLGQGWSNSVHPDDRMIFRRAFLVAVARRQPWRGEYRMRRHDGVWCWVIDSARPLFDDDGAYLGHVGAVIDITERKAAEEALRISEGHFRTLTQAMPHLVWTSEADGACRYLSAGWAEFLGPAPNQKLWRAAIHPEDRAGVDAAWAATESGENYESEYRLRRLDGEYRWFLSRAAPLCGEGGALIRWVGTCTDMTDRKHAEDRQRVLMAELDHRVKNTLAKVQAMAWQTMRTSESPQAFNEAFGARLQALARAHDMLNRSGREGATLGEIVRESLSPIAGRDDGRTVISGETIPLSGRAALTLSVVLHELATNAAKHGALGVPDGRVIVAWRRRGGRIELNWAESGGPPVLSPTRRGFGLRLISESIGHELGGKVALDFNPEGLVCTIRLPASDEVLFSAAGPAG
ncbi:MAG TPA: PAS domain-containing protein [Alphaproteobacteria bacterium]|nr:PAS domain-containing protein [Alphaproteobacteria bacterium]